MQMRFFLLVILIMMASSCSHRGVKTVVFHLPVGFKDVIDITRDHNSTRQLNFEWEKQEAGHVSEVAHIEVPPDGILTLKSFEEFHIGMDEVFLDDNRKSIQFGDVARPSSELMVYDLGLQDEGTGLHLKYVVGTHDDYLKAASKFRSGD